MNAHFATRICACILLTGGLLALGLAFGQIGLIIAGAVLWILAGVLFRECVNYPKKEVQQVELRDRGKETPESW